MHGLIFETSICYWQDQADIFPFTKRREAGLSRHILPPFQTRHLHLCLCPVVFHTGLAIPIENFFKLCLRKKGNFYLLHAGLCSIQICKINDMSQSIFFMCVRSATEIFLSTLFNYNKALRWSESDVDAMWFLPSALNVKVKRFVQARVNGGSNYDSLKYKRNYVN